MKKVFSYESELNDLYNKTLKSFETKIGTISYLQTKYYLNKLLKLNKITKNQNVEEIMNVVGNINLEYKQYCMDNNFYTDSYVNEKIRDSYSKLSKIYMKSKTNRLDILKSKLKMEIKYNSDKGEYEVSQYYGNCKCDSKIYKVKNITNLDKKRKKVLQKMKELNYGINVCDELDVDESLIYKLNPDIINIFLKEDKMDFAKMYIKEVLEGNTVYKPFKIIYELNRDVKKGPFSVVENKNMKRMARHDRLANELVIFDDKKSKLIDKNEVKNTINNIIKNIFDNNKNVKPSFYKYSSKNERNNFVERIRSNRNRNAVFNQIDRINKTNAGRYIKRDYTYSR